MSSFRGMFIAVISAVIFGLYHPAAKLAYADGANATFMILATTFCRAISLCIYCLIKGQPILPAAGKFGSVFTGGFFQALSIFGIIASLVFLPGPVMIIIIFSHTIMLLFYLAYRREIQLTPITVCSTLSALLGLSFVLDVWSQDSNLSLIGILLAFTGAVATMSRLYIFGKLTLELPPAVVGAQTFTMAFIFTLLIVFFEKPVAPETSEGFLWSLICCASLSTGTFGMFFGISLLGSFRWSLFTKCEPIFTALFSVILLHEVLQFSQYFGMLLVLLSLVSYQVLENRTKTVPAGLMLTKPPIG